MSTRTANPEAARSNVVVHGNARFTFLTSRMVRLEYAPDGIFEDRATLAVNNRRTRKVTLTTTRRGKSLTVRTGDLVLTCKDEGKPFSRTNLTIRFKLGGKWVNWHYGKKDTRNLGATVRTLDGATGDQFWLWKQNEQGHWAPDRKVPIDLGNGFISRSGWSVINDSGTPVLDPSIQAMTPWAQERPNGKRVDQYFLGYGLDYKQALADAAIVFGRQPLPPRYTLGYWYSRYWAYTDRDIENMVDQFDRMRIPIDVMVIDMDWHLQGWTGYTWDHDYFPDPTALLKDLRKRGIKITLNLHPADGVGKHEDAFPTMCRDLGLDPEKTDKIPFDCTDPQFIASYFKRLHHPEEKRGVDFWWMDWQQGSETKIKGLDPLPWLNHLHWVDQEQNRPHIRPLNFSRYGGPGSGRYPVGFSGDTHSNWESLAYQPYFTATASNVLYGTWSHDIGGHQPGPVSGELYMRWVQFGAYSPILRTHTSKTRDAERRIWRYDEPYCDIMQEALRERYRMIPYIYSEMRAAADTAISLIRPMYYDHPKAEQAYSHKGQYYFGSRMIVAPVAQPVDPANESAEVSVWLPPGRWFDVCKGALLSGDRIVKSRYLLEEVPVFVKAGSVVPGQGDTTRTYEGSYEHLTIHAYPGGDGSYECYEDDGITDNYRNGQFAYIPMTQRCTGNRRTITIKPVKGTFDEFRVKREVTVHLHGTGPLERVKHNGREKKSVFDGDEAMVTIHLGAINLSRKHVIVAELPKGSPRVFGNGWRGLMRRMRRIGYYANLVSPPHPVHPEERLGVHMGQTSNRLTRWPEKAPEEIRDFTRRLKRLPKALEAFQAEYKLRNDDGAADILQQARNILASMGDRQ